MAFSINNFHFKSPDPRKTAQWYVDNLGAKLSYERDLTSIGTVAIRLELDGVPLMITGMVQGQETKQRYGLEHVGIYTEDLTASLERIEASGGRLLEHFENPYGQKGAFVMGPDDVQLEITHKEDGPSQPKVRERGAAYRIYNFHFKSPDPEKTAGWWADNLGAKIIRKGEVAGTIGIRLDLDGVPLNVTGFVQGQKLEQFAGLEHIGLLTYDIKAALEQLKGAGARLLEELKTPGGHPCAFLEGPEGVRIEVTEMKDSDW